MMNQTIPPEPLTTSRYKALLNQCIRCGLCLTACPTYMVLGTEMEAPRGRIAMIRALSAGRFGLCEPVSRYVYDCIGCQACHVACPSGVIADEIFGTARQILAGSEFFPTPLADLALRVRTTHNISGEPAENRLLWAENLNGKIRDLTGKQTAEVALFTGCVSALYPMVYGILQSTVRFLQAARVDFAILGSDEWCCGYPLLSAGLDISELKTHNLERIKSLGAQVLVTTCPSCYYTWKSHYPANSLRLRSGQAVRVLHAAEFFGELVATGKMPLASVRRWHKTRLGETTEGERLRLRPLTMRVTYHDPCDLGRKSKIYDAPRQVIKAIPGVELVEMKSNRENALCCGGGGNLESLDVELSRAVARLRLQQALDVGAEVIVSACQQCERTLAMAARRERVRIRVMDITQLLDEAFHSGRSLC